MSSVIDLYQVDGSKEKLNFRGGVGASDLVCNPERTHWRKNHLSSLLIGDPICNSFSSCWSFPFFPNTMIISLKLKHQVQ